MSPNEDFPADKLDQWLEPPDEPERCLPISVAPLSAILRAVEGWVDDKERLQSFVAQVLSDAGCEDVELTEAEWQAHCQGIVEQTQER